MGGSGGGRTVISFVVPCFNSTAYMDRALASLVVGGTDVEVIIVDDGSTRDDTAQKADAWAREHPGVVRVIHQENRGHGGAVNAGLRAAIGEYVMVVDSDDWLDPDALGRLLPRLRGFLDGEAPPDIVVTNYVYEHVASHTAKAMRYRRALPVDRPFGWDDLGHFGPAQSLTMRTLIYRTRVLRASGLELPEHTFYVDNIYAYVPLSYAETLHYLPLDLYRYFIGRPDQSVSHATLVRQADQHIAVARIMADAARGPVAAAHPTLERYLDSFLGTVVTASCALAAVNGSAKALEQRRAMWEHIHATDPALEQRLRRQFLVWGTNLPGAPGRFVARTGYRLAQVLYGFN